MSYQAALDAGNLPATFAAGCYWGTERYFTKVFGKKAGADGSALAFHQVGFMAGARDGKNPTGKPYVESPGYRAVCSGETGLAEVLHLLYNPNMVSYKDLCELFFRMHNPTTVDCQGNDKGTQYRSAIMYHSDDQRSIAEKLISELNDSGGSDDIVERRQRFQKAFGENAKVVTTVEPCSAFFPAHDEHQGYLDVNPEGYCNHRIYW
eukprot:Tbor_TRINITY_DN154_c0_g1::TRINITY_DN154_c0_g1_i1::g.12008::m.12008/K07304/msrA; peptide-methionine (S)-S-oxide reductase